ncbi:lysophospholipid acyltransferase 1 isoform X2 [Brachyhypopomus gauderio]|uniref:lysophospholipid acyltransferase 1 isoform X2 n=1 Tax=Brachyhypopomus gauderio TaxID=698409 RepID=UPI00404227F9
MGEQSDMSFKTTGSTWLDPLSDLVGIPLDQVNFIICQVFALFIGFWFRLYLKPQRAGAVLRHAVATLFGVSLIIFCFGWYALHIFVLTLACYGILCRASIHAVHWYSLVAALGYLTVCQVSRVFIFNYGILSTDFSGPLMMVTQKITTVAFQVHDGLGRKQDDLTPDQRRLAVTTRPSLLEYLSYNLNFMSILVGPCSNYHDYIDFIEGRHVWRKLTKPRPGSGLEPNGYGALPEHSPMRAVCQKLLVCIGCVVWFFTISRSFPISHNVDPEFVSQTPFLSRLAYAFVSIQAARPKFYFAWTLADAIHNAAGYGISGVDDKGRVSWDLVSNIHIWEIEATTSFKTFIDNWNIQTGVWLKSACYDRVPHYRTPLTFGLSALWHGVYPGYYFTFLTGIPITLAARAVRRNLRPYFVGSRGVKLAYDIVTWAATQFSICYTVMPFLLLAVEPTLTYYRSMYFHVHIISILAVILLPRRPRSSNPTNHVHHSNNNVKGD